MKETELEILARKFAECSLPKEDWTHAAHLSVGLWHVEKYGAEEALRRLRIGIRKLNQSYGGANSSTSGYHESISRLRDTALNVLETFP